MVVDTVFDAATVELKVPVATPSPSVGPTGCVTVFPVPVAATTTVAPAIGLPSASRAVTVMVELPLPAVIGDVAVTVDRLADTAAGFTTTVAVCVMATALIVADTVFAPAAVDASVPVTTPLAFVVPTGCVSVLPAAGVAARVTVAPGIGFRFASRAVTVIVDVLVPPDATMGEVALRPDWPPDTLLAITTTVAVCVTATDLIVADTVLDSATVERNEPVATPLALVGPAGCVSVLPAPVAASVTAAPGIGLPN